jgi:hypothetical protein
LKVKVLDNTKHYDSILDDSGDIILFGNIKLEGDKEIKANVQIWDETNTASLERFMFVQTSWFDRILLYDSQDEPHTYTSNHLLIVMR